MLTTVDKRRTLTMWTRGMLITERSSADVEGWAYWLHTHMDARECDVPEDICKQIAKLVAERKNSLSQPRQSAEEASNEYDNYERMLYDSQALGDKYRQERAMKMMYNIARNSWTDDKPASIYEMMDIATVGPFPYPTLDWEMCEYIHQRVDKVRDLYLKRENANSELERETTNAARAIVREAYAENRVN